MYSLCFSPCMFPCLSGCSWVPEPVSGPAERRCGKNEQKLHKRSCSLLIFLHGLWEWTRGNSAIIGRQGRAWWRSGHLPHLHLPRGGQHGVWGAAHYRLQRVRPVSCSIIWICPCNVFCKTVKTPWRRWKMWLHSWCVAAVARWWQSESSSTTCLSTYRAERKPSRFDQSRTLWISFLGWVFSFNCLLVFTLILIHFCRRIPFFRLSKLFIFFFVKNYLYMKQLDIQCVNM